MINVDEAAKLVTENTRQFEPELVVIEQATGRVLAEEVLADRDLPPYDRVTMDGIAIKYSEYKNGTEQFAINSVQAAGISPEIKLRGGECVQIMTGAALPRQLDTIIPIEDIKISENIATIMASKVVRGQFVHKQATDKKAGDILIKSGAKLTPAHIAMAASVGKTKLRVTKQPKIAVVSTGDELVGINQIPKPHQIRRSNDLMLQSALLPFVSDTFHIKDNKQIMEHELQDLLSKYELVILSGGVSKGDFDFVPEILNSLGVNKIFHGVAQRPGKPLWFGQNGQSTVFGLPGNPVSSLVCLYKYVLPWLNLSMGQSKLPTVYVVLASDIDFEPKLTYFVQAKVGFSNNGELVATPLKNNGSGDFASLAKADAFIELPAGKSRFKAGQSYKLLPLKSIM